MTVDLYGSTTNEHSFSRELAIERQPLDRRRLPAPKARVRRLRAAAGTLLFLGLAPGVVAGLVPWLLTGWRATTPPIGLSALGFVLLAAGVAVVLDAFARFVLEGVGTPAPPAPTEKLVVGGLYRYVRNPMYLAVTAVILGQAAVLGSWVLVVYAFAFGLTVCRSCTGTRNRRSGASSAQPTMITSPPCPAGGPVGHVTAAAELRNAKIRISVVTLGAGHRGSRLGS
jgi:protein-S-isoprenylcysteine O-methyltransferase Ste14